MSDRLAGLLLGPLADVSIRWGLLILALAAWLAIRPPRRAATRHMLCVAALLAGPALMLIPRWDAYVYGVRPSPAPAFAQIPVPDFRQERPLAPAQVEAIEARVAVEARPTPPRPAAPVDWAGVAAKVAVAAWVAGTLLMLARLGLGVRAMRRWARRATPATADDLAMLDACRAGRPTSRRVRLMRHREVASPAVVGGFAPTILLPPDWDAWPADRRRAALRHELAHVRRYDDASRLLEELVRVPMWFHPAVAWLLARLDRERELLCDEAAVAAGDDPKGLARLLLDLSRSPSPRRLPSASLPFLTRRTTAVRIRRLLEDDMPRTLSRPSLARPLLLGPAALAALLALGTTRVREASAQDAPAPQVESAPDLPIESRKTAASPRAIEGSVVDPEGKPIPGATVVVDGRAGFGRRFLTTDDVGKFSTPSEPGNGSVSILVGKPGFAPASGFRLGAGSSMNPDPTKRPIKLARAEPFSGSLVDEQGRPMAGATLRIVRSEWIARIAAARRPDFEFYNSQFPRETTAETPFEEALTARTAEDGSFTFPGAVGSEASVRLEIIAPDGRPRILRRPERKGRGGAHEQMGWIRIKAQERPRLVAIEGANIEGRIVSQVPNVDPTTLQVTVSAIWPGQPAPPPDDSYPRSTRPDAQGRFTLDGLELGTVRIDIHGPGAVKTWTYRPILNLALNSGEAITPTIEIIPGVEVSGRIVSGKTGRPFAGAMLEFNDPDDTPHSTRHFGLKIDAEGRYACRLLPGKTYRFTLAGIPPGVSRGRTSVKFDVPEGVTTLPGPAFDLDRVETISGRVLDADGRPIVGAKVEFLAVAPPPKNDRASSSTDDRGAFRLQPAAGREEAGKPIALWIELVDGRKFKADAAPDAAGEYVVKFAERGPAAQQAPAAIVPEAPPQAPAGVAPIEGAVVDPDGKAVAGATVVVAGDGDFGRRTLTTDDAGRFSTPGARGEGSVYVLAVKAGYAPASTIHNLESARPDVVQNALVLKLSRPAPFAATLVDEEDRPISGATVRVTRMAVRSDLDGDGTRIMTAFFRFPRESTAGTPIDPMLTATTAADGSFTLPEAAPSGYGLRLEITAADGRPRLVPRPKWDRRDWSLEHQGFVIVRPGEAIRLKTLPPARIVGKVVVEVPGVEVSRLRAWIQGSRPRPDAPPESVNLQGESPVDAEGRFVIDGLDSGTVNVFVHGEGEARSWTYRAVKDLELAPGRDSAAEFELIEGVEVSGLVTSKDGGRPIPGAKVAVYGPFRPKTGATTVAHATDADGRYRFRLPPGETYLYVFDVPAGYSRDPEDPEGHRTVTIPEGVARFEAPPLRAKANGAPLPGATEKAGPAR